MKITQIKLFEDSLNCCSLHNYKIFWNVKTEKKLHKIILKKRGGWVGKGYEKSTELSVLFIVGRLGLEPRLFCTKSRRVASYTIGHCLNGRQK